MTESQHITLRELQRRVKSALEGQFALPLWVSAEISEIKVNYSGHCYLELVEKGGDNGVPTAQARAVVWRSNYPRIAGYFEAETGQRLAAGIRILAKVLVTYHELTASRSRSPTSTLPTRWATCSGSGSRPSTVCARRACGT